MTNNTNTITEAAPDAVAEAAPSLLSRMVSKLVGPNRAPVLEPARAFLASCDDPAELDRKADADGEEAAAIERVRNRERGNSAGLRTPERWEDGIEAGNRILELSISAGQCREKAAKIRAAAEWRRQRVEDGPRIKTATKDAEAKRKTERGLYERLVADLAGRVSAREQAEAKDKRLADRFSAADVAHAAAIERQAGELLADDSAALASGEVAGLAADKQAMTAARALLAKQLEGLRAAESGARSAAEAQRRAYLAAVEACIAARLALREYEGRELLEEWAAVRLLQGVGPTPHRAVLIDGRAAEAAAEALREEFGS